MARERTIPIAIVRGAGALGSAVAHTLWHAGYRVLCTDLARPLAIRRGAAFANALYDGRASLEGLSCERISYADEAVILWRGNILPVIADPEGRVIPIFEPEVLVDAMRLGRAGGTTCDQAGVVIGLGNEFSAGRDCHITIALPDAPDSARELRAPFAGLLRSRRAIGDSVKPGAIIADIGNTPVSATLGGVVRGTLHDGVIVSSGMIIANIDPRGDARRCFVISERARATAERVLAELQAFRRAQPL